MSCTTTTSSASPAPRRRWQEKFLKLLPKITKYARFAFRHVCGQDREDLIEEVIANAMVAFRRLVRRGKEAVAHASVLAKYAVAKFEMGAASATRPTSARCSRSTPSSTKASPRPAMDSYDPIENEWTQRVVEDRHAGPADVARVRLDFSDWLDSLKRRDRKVAEFLAKGESTKAAARKFDVSQGRVSQLRRELAESWRQFIGDEPLGGAALAV